MHRRRVAITGIGIVSCFGLGRDAAREAVVNGRSGVRRIEGIDASNLNCRIAAEVTPGIVPRDPKADRFTRLALAAADEAIAQSNLAGSVDPERIGTIIATGLGGTETLDAGYDRLYAKGNHRLPPTIIPNSMYNAATSAVSARHKLLGPAYAIVSACASATHAIGHAASWVRDGLADAVVVGGSDAPLSIGVIRAWEALRILSIDNEHPERACRPFSADRAGIVLAEGAAVFVLESFDRATARYAQILGEIAGFGLSSDAGHITDPSAEGAGRAMRGALSDAGVSPSEVDYINAHGTGTKANDSTETAAIRLVFGTHADALPVSSTKSMHGHAMGASGAIELAVSLLALNDGVIPPTINFTGDDPACDLDYVPNIARRADVGFFLSNSFGFGGMNAVLAVRTSNGTAAAGPEPH